MLLQSQIDNVNIVQQDVPMPTSPAPSDGEERPNQNYFPSSEMGALKWDKFTNGSHYGIQHCSTAVLR